MSTHQSAAPRHRASAPHRADTRHRPTPFPQRLASGDYAAFLGRGLRRMLRGAAADPGLEIEIGAVRLALLRLLDEEADPTRLATGVARLTAVAAQAGRLRALSAADGGLAEVRAILQRELDELDRERSLARGADNESLDDHSRGSPDAVPATTAYLAMPLADGDHRTR